MADTLEPKQEALRENESSGGIAELRAELQQLRAEIQQARSDAVREAIASIVLQGGGDAQVSGGNGKFTINVNPPARTATWTIECNEDGTMTGTLTV